MIEDDFFNWLNAEREQGDLTDSEIEEVLNDQRYAVRLFDRYIESWFADERVEWVREQIKFFKHKLK